VVLTEVKGKESVMKKSILILVIMLASYSIMSAQFIEDALRYTTPNAIISIRAAGLGASYHGMSDDISALMFNPAGLSVSGKSELSVGYGFSVYDTETDFMGYKTEKSTNNEYLTNAGLMGGFDVGGKKVAVAISYFRENDFHNYMTYGGFNSYSTYINDQAVNGSRNYEKNLSTFLSLANENFYTPMKDSLYQSATILEGGGLHNISGGAAFDVGETASIGFAVAGKWGNYDYQRDYEEYDTFNKYKTFDPDNYSDLDFRKLTVNENLNQEVWGITGNIGFQMRVSDFMRLGGAIKFPTFYAVEEHFSQEAEAEFDNGDVSQNPYYSYGANSYNLVTPFVYSGGVSFHALGFVFSAGVEYTDVSQCEFSDGPEHLDELNLKMLDELAGQTTWGFGAEWNLPELPVVVRASYSSTTSPYADDIPGANFERLALGGGIYLSSNFRIDLLMRFTEYSEVRTNYLSGYGSEYIMNREQNNIGLQLTYRY